MNDNDSRALPQRKVVRDQLHLLEQPSGCFWILAVQQAKYALFPITVAAFPTGLTCFARIWRCFRPISKLQTDSAPGPSE